MDDKKVTKIGETPERTLELWEQMAPKDQFIKEQKNEAKIDPAKLLTDLKMRAALLNKLMTDGHAPQNAGELKSSLAETITELEGIIADPETDRLSGDEV